MGLYYCYSQENAAVHKHSWVIKRAQTKPEVLYIAGADPAFCLHTRKMRCQTLHMGSNPTHMEEHKRRVRPRNRGKWIPFTLRAKGGVWPRIWGSTPQSQSEHCVNAVNKQCLKDHKFWGKLYYHSLSGECRQHCCNSVNRRKSNYRGICKWERPSGNGRNNFNNKLSQYHKFGPI